ncbi:hypothetical protein MAUB1S_01259 [Mycolicibacterium aubagnense]
MAASEAYVIDAVRTAVGKKGGALAGYHPIDLGVEAYRGISRATTSTPPRSTTSLSVASTPSVGRPATSVGSPGSPPDTTRASPAPPLTGSAVPRSRPFPLARRRSCPALPT